MNKHELDIFDRGFGACVFDLDGVIADTASMHVTSWKTMFDEFLTAWSDKHGKTLDSFDPVEDYENYIAGKERPKAIRDFLTSRSIILPEGHHADSPNEMTVYGLSNRKNTILTNLMSQRGVKVYDGSLRFLYMVREAGMKTAVVSSSRNASAILKAARIENLFDATVDGNVVNQVHLRKKPSPDTFLEAAHRLAISPEAIIVLEDNPDGITAGRAGHFGLVIGVDRIGHKEDLVTRGADVVVRDLDELIKQ